MTKNIEIISLLYLYGNIEIQRKTVIIEIELGNLEKTKNFFPRFARGNPAEQLCRISLIMSLFVDEEKPLKLFLRGLFGNAL